MKSSQLDHRHQEIDYLKIATVILNKWTWITGILVGGWMLSCLYLRYTPPLYSCQASLKFDDSRSEISELLQVKNRFYRQDKIEAEKFILQSYSVRMQAARLLNRISPVSFFSKENFLTTDLYPEKVLNIEITKLSDVFFQEIIRFKGLNNDHFELSFAINGNKYYKKIKCGASVVLPGIEFKVFRPVKRLPGELYFKFNTNEALAERIEKGLRVEENSDDGILHLKLTDVNTQFATHALNHLMQAYLITNKTQRSVSALQTVLFIDTLLLDMQKAVASTGKAVEAFKIKNDFFDLSADAAYNALKLTKLEAEKQQLEMLSVNIRSIENDVQQNNATNHLNFNIQGTTDPMLATLVQQFNQVLLQKKEMTEFYSASSGTVTKIDRQILDIKSTILNNISMQKKKNHEGTSYLNREISKLRKSYKNLPVAERDLISLKSAFDVNQKIFNYLSEKKLEARISQAAATPSAFIVDEARPSATIVSPNPGKAYTIATLGSLCTSLLLIFGLRAWRPRIYSRESLEELTDIGVIGTVSSFPGGTPHLRPSMLLIDHVNAAFAESIRSIRTHLAFLATDKFSKIICITSEISGEGKSLISLNLSGALSLLEKKVILISTDLRKPKMQEMFCTKNNKGLSDYLAGVIGINDVICPSSIKNLSFIASGSIPPNPGELLFSERMKQLLDKLRQEYAFIVLDTAPIGLVSDAVPLARLSDINLFVIRAGFSRPKSAALPVTLKETYDLANLYLILNDVKPDFQYKNYYAGGYHA